MSSSGWQETHSNHQVIDFDELFTQPDFNIIKLLATNNIIDECKRQNDKITQVLIKNSKILQDLMLICIKPTKFKSQDLIEVTNEHTYKAIEILNNLNTQQFSDYLLGGLEGIPEIEDEVITQDNMENKQAKVNSIPLVTTLFSVLKQPMPLSQTPLWYMYKVGTSTCYQKPKKLLGLLRDNRHIADMLFLHFYSNSILQWIIKILELQDSNSFFQPEKVIIFSYFVQHLGKQVEQFNDKDSTPQEQQLLHCKLQNYIVVMKALLQKMQDRFDKSKYLNLAKQIYSKKQPIEPFINRIVKITTQQMVYKQEQQIILLLSILQKYLHFSSNYKPITINNVNNSINRSRSMNKSGNNMDKEGERLSGVMGAGLDASSVNQIILNAEASQNIRKTVTIMSSQLTASQQRKFKLSFIIEYLKLLLAVLLVNQQSQYKFIEQILTPQLSEFLFTLAQAHNSCTILHNLVKDIFIQCLFKQYQHTVRILFKSSFLRILNDMKGKTNSNSREYQNQLYHIFQITIKKSEETNANSKAYEEVKKGANYFQDIFNNVKEKEKLYSALIGGNPRKQSSCWGDSSQDEKLLSFNFNQQPIVEKKNINQQNILSPNNTNDIIQGNIEHWFDCGGLPLDSDQSKDEQNPSKSQQVIDGEKKESNSPLNELARRFKNIGIVECQEKQIRIPMKKERYSNSKGTNKEQSGNQKLQGINQNEQEKKLQPKDIKDKQELELEREIKILQNKRLHLQEDDKNQIDSPEIIARLKKKVDSLDEYDSRLNFNEEKNTQRHKGGSKDISQLLDQSDEKQMKSQKGIINKMQNRIEDNQKIAVNHNKSENKKAGQAQQLGGDNLSSYFQTYLSFQIEQILSQLD